MREEGEAEPAGLHMSLDEIARLKKEEQNRHRQKQQHNRQQIDRGRQDYARPHQQNNFNRDRYTGGRGRGRGYKDTAQPVVVGFQPQNGGMVFSVQNRAFMQGMMQGQQAQMLPPFGVPPMVFVQPPPPFGAPPGPGPPGQHPAMPQQLQYAMHPFQQQPPQQQQQLGGPPRQRPSLRQYEKCTIEEDTGDAVFTFQETELVRVTSYGDVILSSGGVQDATMLQALNDALRHLDLKITALDATNWSVRDGKSLVRFQDGMVLHAMAEDLQREAPENREPRPSTPLTWLCNVSDQVLHAKGGGAAARGQTLYRAFNRPKAPAAAATSSSPAAVSAAAAGTAAGQGAGAGRGAGMPLQQSALGRLGPSPAKRLPDGPPLEPDSVRRLRAQGRYSGRQ